MGVKGRIFSFFHYHNKCTAVFSTQPRSPQGAHSPSPQASDLEVSAKVPPHPPPDQPAKRAHHAAHWKPQRRGQDEDHDHLYHRCAREGRGGQNDHGQGTSRWSRGRVGRGHVLRSSAGVMGDPVAGSSRPRCPSPSLGLSPVKQHAALRCGSRLQ